MRAFFSARGLRILVVIALLGLAPSAWALEKLDRSLVAVRLRDSSVYLSWRLRAEDPPGTRFEVLRASSADALGEAIHSSPIFETTDYVDRQAPKGSVFYRVRALSEGKKFDESHAVAPDPASPIGGVRTFKLGGKYRAQKVGLADFNGDGALDYLVKQPDFNTDPYQMPGYWKKSEEPYQLEAYQHDGQLLWRYDMGWSIETGIWYSPIMVFDLDGDGKTEVYCKAGEGDPRDERGLVQSGPEYLVKLDPMTGRVLAKIEWLSREGMDSKEGDPTPHYNYYSRNFLAVAYLDGKRPYLIVERGTYTRIKVRAYDRDLKTVWHWESEGADRKYRGQGTHGLQVADIDEDGRDELVIGAAALDDDGRALWTTGLGHPDVCYVGDIDPRRPGFEIFYGQEVRRSSNGVSLVEAKTGKLIWSYSGPTTHVHGQGMVADLDPGHPGMECYAGEKDGSRFWLYSAAGELLSSASLGELSPRPVFWTAAPVKLIVSQGKLGPLGGPPLGPVSGRVVALADCLGDWREEIITSTEGEVQIHTTTIPAVNRRVGLLQNRQYRTAVAGQTMGYFYPPILGREDSSGR